jgi:hypothetical protein
MKRLTLDVATRVARIDRQSLKQGGFNAHEIVLGTHWGRKSVEWLKKGGLQKKGRADKIGATFRHGQNSIRNEAVDYFSLMTVVLLVPLVLPTVPSSQTLVCLMRSSASTRLVKAIGPICVTTSLSAGRVVVIVQ